VNAFSLFIPGRFLCSLRKPRGKCKKVPQRPAARHIILPPSVRHHCPASTISSRSILQSRPPALPPCSRAPKTPVREKLSGPCNCRGYPPLACRTPDSPARQIQMFPEHRDERRDRPRDSSARGRLSRCNIESTTRCRSRSEAVEVDRVAARRRARADENRPGGALSSVQNFS